MYPSFNARALGLPHLPVDLTIDLAAEAGFAGVDLMVRDLVRSGTDLAMIRRHMDRRQLRPGAFPMPIDWRGDEASFWRGLAELPAVAAAAATLGLTRTGTWVLPETSTMPPPRSDPAEFRAAVARWHLDRISAIASILADHEIRLGLEVIGVASFRQGHGVPFITQIGELETTLTALRHDPRVGLLPDAFHLYAGGESYDQALAWGADRVVWAHVADLPAGSDADRAMIFDHQRALPEASGIVDCRRFLNVLAEAKYDGPVTAEPLALSPEEIEKDWSAVARRVKQALDACWPTSA